MKELIKPEYYPNIFILLFSIAGLSLLFSKLWFNKRLNINVSRPNVYIFEFESQSKHIFSSYNINAGLFKILTFTLYIISVLKSGLANPDLSVNNINWDFLLLVITGYFILKFFLEAIFVFSIKKSNFLNKIRFVRTTYENYTFFYLFFISFLVYYFPYQSVIFLHLIISISIVWIIGVWLNIYFSLRKHTELKTYQNILYLCLSEILPFILLFGWVIFQIL